MKAMVLKGLCSLEDNKSPLELLDLSNPEPGKNEILVKVSACEVCHTELDEIEGRTPPPRFPVVPGHQVVGQVEKACEKRGRLKVGDRRSNNRSGGALPREYEFSRRSAAELSG